MLCYKVDPAALLETKIVDQLLEAGRSTPGALTIAAKLCKEEALPLTLTPNP